MEPNLLVELVVVALDQENPSEARRLMNILRNNEQLSTALDDEHQTMILKALLRPEWDK